MWFWYYILGTVLLIPLIVIICGIMMQKRCPKNINHIFGYRTSRSMKNMDTWKFAHEYCGRLWWRLGIILIVPSVLVLIPFYASSDDVIGVVGTVIALVQCALLFIPILQTESALKRTFNNDGARK